MGLLIMGEHILKIALSELVTVRLSGKDGLVHEMRLGKLSQCAGDLRTAGQMAASTCDAIQNFHVSLQHAQQLAEGYSIEFVLTLPQE